MHMLIKNPMEVPTSMSDAPDCRLIASCLLRLAADARQIATMMDGIRMGEGANNHHVGNTSVDLYSLFVELNTMAARYGATHLSDDELQRLASVEVSSTMADESGRYYRDLIDGLAVASDGVLLVQTLIHNVEVAQDLKELISRLNDTYYQVAAKYGVV